MLETCHRRRETVSVRSVVSPRMVASMQKVNAFHGRLTFCIARFRRVATSHLENYFGWFRALDRAGKSRLKAPPILALAAGLRGITN